MAELKVGDIIIYQHLTIPVDNVAYRIVDLAPIGTLGVPG